MDPSSRGVREALLVVHLYQNPAEMAIFLVLLQLFATLGHQRILGQAGSAKSKPRVLGSHMKTRKGRNMEEGRNEQTNESTNEGSCYSGIFEFACEAIN